MANGKRPMAKGVTPRPKSVGGGGERAKDGRDRRPFSGPGDEEPNGSPQVTHSVFLPEEALLYTRDQVACLMQISVRSVDRFVQNGELTPARMPGRLVRFRREDVLRWLSEVSARAKGQGFRFQGGRPENRAPANPPSVVFRKQGVFN